MTENYQHPGERIVVNTPSTTSLVILVVAVATRMCDAAVGLATDTLQPQEQAELADDLMTLSIRVRRHAAACEYLAPGAVASAELTIPHIGASSITAQGQATQPLRSRPLNDATADHLREVNR